jgi:hypothetical protein
MKEALFILLIIGVILALTAYRYRRQIATMLHIWRSFKAVRDQVKQKSDAPPVEGKASGRLVNCARCGTWVPEERAIELRGGTRYCSAVCLETTSAPR